MRQYGKEVAGNRQQIMARLMEFKADRAKFGHAGSRGARSAGSQPQLMETNGGSGYCFGG